MAYSSCKEFQSQRASSINNSIANSIKTRTGVVDSFIKIVDRFIKTADSYIKTVDGFIKVVDSFIKSVDSFTKITCVSTFVFWS